MLPSMPLLLLSSQDTILNDVSSNVMIGIQLPRSSEQNVVESNTVIKKASKPDQSQKIGEHCSSIVTDNILPFESLPAYDKECDDELVLLANSSSPHSEKRKHILQNHSSKKRKKLDNNSCAAFTEEIGSLDDKAHHFAETYFMKARSTLDDAIFQKFIITLSSFNENSGNVIELYSQVMDVLKGHFDLSEEFIGFLLPHQSLGCSLFMEYMYIDKAWTFFRKADACHLNKVMHVFEQHASNSTSTLEHLRNSVLPLLKGHPLLVEAFLELLPNEKPPPSSLEDYEDITGNTGVEGDWERLRIPSHPDRGCGNNCCCKCHAAKHLCTSCNIKFMNGQIFIQYGKLMRFARLHFNGSDTENELRRLHPIGYTKPRKKRKPVRSPKDSVNSSSEVSKENQANLTGALNEEVGDDLQIKSEDFGDYDLMEGNDDDVIEDEDENEDYCFEDDKMSETSSGEGDKSLDSINGDLIEFDYVSEGKSEAMDVSPVINDNKSDSGKPKDADIPALVVNDKEKEAVPDTLGEAKYDESSLSGEESGEIVGDESESNESSDGIHDYLNKQTECGLSNSASWTREEDKVILEAFQKELDTEHTFSKISCLMPTRSVHDIQGRFQVLMKLLEKVASGSHENHPV